MKRSGARSEVQATIERLIASWQRERLAARERFVAERRLMTFEERLSRGLAGTALYVDEVFPSPGGRLVLCLRSDRDGFDRHRLRLRSGDPVVLHHVDPDEAGRLVGVVERWRGEGLGVTIEGELPERFEERPFRLEREAPEHTFDRGALALGKLGSAHGDLGHLLEVAYGLGRLETLDPFEGLADPHTRPFLDPDLDEVQHEAIHHSLVTSPLALLHGPPGTGKTRCLVEIIRQCVARGERVLAVAASNVAVDNLTERLAVHGLKVLRLGHPARVLPEVEGLTLASRLDEHEGAELARRWVAEANDLKQRTEKQAARGTGTREGRREAFAESRRLLKDARAHLRRVESAIVAQSQVICATLAGADANILRDQTFDRVVVDEATQALDPLLWIALARAPRAILAGDPHQLAPTVIDPVAEKDLGLTLFDRLAKRLEGRAVRMLERQHRMHVDIMRFPSEALYGGRLVASEAVADHRLEALGVAVDPDRDAPRVFVDTAGAGFVEVKREPDRSTMNPEMASVTAREVERLIARGLAPSLLAVLTPYDAQVGVLRALLAVHVERGLEVGSIDGFQGREKEAIVLDLVRSNDDGELGFLTDVRRINVALTRARRFLLVVGDSATLGTHPFYARLLEDVEHHGLWLSVFSEPVTQF